MSASLVTHPIVAAALWRAWLECGLQPARRDFELNRIEVEGRARRLLWRAWDFGPFATISEVQRADVRPERTVLLIPAMSGAFPFVMRDMAASFVSDSRVRVLEWINARYAPGKAGPFLFDDQTDLIAGAIRQCEEPPHVVALCQGGAPALAAAAIVAAEGEGRGAASLSLIASPIRPEAAASMVSSSIDEKAVEKIEASMVWRRTVPGDMRRVFPAQAHCASLASTLAAQRPDRDEFSAMILESVENPPKGAPRFWDLIAAYMDLPAEFLLDNLTRLYLSPPPGVVSARWRGAPLDLRSLDRTPMAVVEGGRDKIAAPGQTRAAYDATPGRGAAREALLLPESGHFSLFYGPVWRSRVYPRLTALIDAAEKGAPAARRRAAEKSDGSADQPI